MPSTVNAINVAHAGMPREKFFVPSIGSSTQQPSDVGHLAAALLAEHRVRGPLGGDQRAQRLLGGRVGVGDGAAVGLGRHPQVGGPEPGERDGVGGVGQPQREREVGIHGVTPCRTVHTRSTADPA